jgi:predicted Zn finger-like uncharacterized protein
MDLYTRCAHCSTIFRVTTQQLQASAGRVRCGHCQLVFDAFASLTVQEPEKTGLQVSPSMRERAPEGAPAVPPIFAGQGHAQSGKAQAPSRPDPAAGLYEWEFKMPQTPRHTLGWSLMTLMLSIALAVQGAYAFRTEITVLLPQTHGYYTRICEILGCTFAPPKISSHLHIEASDLKAEDPSHPGEMQLWLTVRNRAPVELAYPAFELTLTNAVEQAVGRRVFLPAEYLPTSSQAVGLRAGAELPIHLYLDTGTLRANGYRLYLFYP